jgi:hypothetical protein
MVRPRDCPYRGTLTTVAAIVVTLWMSLVGAKAWLSGEAGGRAAEAGFTHMAGVAAREQAGEWRRSEFV